MKTKKIAVLLLTLFLTMALSPMSVFAATTVKADSTASIIVENAVENDVLAAYKIIDITYNATTNNLTYAWNNDFANYFTGTTVEEFATLTDDSAELKNLLAGLPNYIGTPSSISPVDTQTVAADGTATFENLAMGAYFIRPTNTTSVYQLMLQKVEPTVNSETKKYVIDDVTFSAKHEEATIEKTADKTSVTKNENVTYTITVDIPTYGAEAIDKSFYISDLLPDGLTLVTGSIKATIENVEVDKTAYTLDTTVASGYTFKFSVDKTQYAASWSNKGGKELVIKYSAKFNDDNTTAVNTPETNTATFNYSNYPYVNNSYKQKTSAVSVNTFAIKIDKHVKDNESQKLGNAEFDLYRAATQAEIDASKSVIIPHTSINGILLESQITDTNNGEAKFEKYEANGTNYDYYLVETKAPTGYNILGEAKKINFTNNNVDENGVYTVKVPNSSGLTLPITGGEGIVFFSVIGIVFMGGAVFLFVISRKKSKTKCKK